MDRSAEILDTAVESPSPHASTGALGGLVSDAIAQLQQQVAQTRRLTDADTSPAAGGAAESLMAPPAASVAAGNGSMPTWAYTRHGGHVPLWQMPRAAALVRAVSSSRSADALWDELTGLGGDGLIGAVAPVIAGFTGAMRRFASVQNAPL